MSFHFDVGNNSGKVTNIFAGKSQFFENYRKTHVYLKISFINIKGNSKVS